MKENVDVADIKLEAMELVDLGDAAVETRQVSPAPFYTDHHYGLGEWPGR